jgi:hypothetical protein
MAERTREQIEAEIRQQTPTIEVCSNGACQQWTTGDDAYEAWLTSTVDEHVAADAVMREEDARKLLAQEVRTALDLLDNGATLAQTRTILARLIRYLVRTGVIG